MKKMITENVIKNIILIAILIPAYFSVESNLFLLGSNLDKSILGSLLGAVGILSVAACFGNFAFTYEKIKVNSLGSRLLAHMTTGLFMLLIGLSLEMTAVFARILLGKFIILDLSFIILYFASVLYDFWDLQRNNL